MEIETKKNSVNSFVMDLSKSEDDLIYELLTNNQSGPLRSFHHLIGPRTNPTFHERYNSHLYHCKERTIILPEVFEITYEGKLTKLSAFESSESTANTIIKLLADFQTKYKKWNGKGKKKIWK